MARDPVCGMEVEETEARAITTYEDEDYYFCSRNCKEQFDREPERFIGRDKARRFAG